MNNFIKFLLVVLVCAIATQGLWMIFATNPMTVAPLLILVGSLLLFGTLLFLIVASIILVGASAAYLVLGDNFLSGGPATIIFAGLVGFVWICMVLMCLNEQIQINGYTYVESLIAFIGVGALSIILGSTRFLLWGRKAQ